MSEQLDVPSDDHTHDPAHFRDLSITSENLPSDDTVNVSITVTENDDEMGKTQNFDDLEPESDPVPRAYRSRSLPPAYLMVTTPPVSPVPPESEEDHSESNLDTSPSHLRQSPGWRSPEPESEVNNTLSHHHTITPSHCHAYTHTPIETQSTSFQLGGLLSQPQTTPTKSKLKVQALHVSNSTIVR